MHSGRRAFNGIRPENVRIDIEEDGQPKVSLIDFSDATKYVDEIGHIGKSETQNHNLLLEKDLTFDSLQKMKNLKTARNDDIISLYYMIIYLANGDKIPKLEHIQDESVQDAISEK